MPSFTRGIGALAATGAALLGTMTLAGPAAAKSRCPRPENALVPYLTYPCNGATIKRGSKVTFKVSDRSTWTKKWRPTLNLLARRTLVDNHLRSDSSGRGIYEGMTGHSGAFSLTKGGGGFPGYWSDTRGTYYVQVEQVDPRAGSAGVFYSPIITIHVR